MAKSFYREICNIYSGSLTPADFNFAHFKKIAHISSLCNFHNISYGILSLMHFWLLIAADLVHAELQHWHALELTNLLSRLTNLQQ